MTKLEELKAATNTAHHVWEAADDASEAALVTANAAHTAFEVARDVRVAALLDWVAAENSYEAALREKRHE